MKECVDPQGHLWFVKGPTTDFLGHKSQMVICVRDGCKEIGYRIYERQDS